MAAIHPSDRVPLLGAVFVMLLANVVGFVIGVTVYISVLGAPIAVTVFGLLRYLDDGTPYPAALSG
jgi:uncharacterized membrane protein